jgi:hypothetical protein
MDVVVLDPQCTPWVCRMCARGFWTSELTNAARKMYRPQYHDWGFGPEAVQLRQQVTMEVVDAMMRGTSLRPDLLPRVPRHTIEALVPQVRPAFRELLKQYVAKLPLPEGVRHV